MDRDVDLEKISEVLKAMAHPVRLQILEGLIKNECNVNYIQQKLGLPQSTVSQHLKTLKNAGIIKGRREKTKVCYSILDKRVIEIIHVITSGEFF